MENTEHINGLIPAILHNLEMKKHERDLYYLRIAREVSKRSKCLSRKIGSVLVKNDSLISIGFNGPARGVKHCNERGLDFYKNLEKSVTGEFAVNFAFDEKATCPRRLFGYSSGKGLHLCSAVHSERNAILQAARNGISTDGVVLYCYCPIPCSECMREIIQAGIKEVVCLKGDDYDGYARIMAREACIDITEINLGELL